MVAVAVAVPLEPVVVYAEAIGCPLDAEDALGEDHVVGRGGHFDRAFARRDRVDQASAQTALVVGMDRPVDAAVLVVDLVDRSRLPALPSSSSCPSCPSCPSLEQMAR